MLIHKTAWICLDSKKVLMVRSKGKDLFYIPGGKVEKGESEQQALIREIKEELTVNIIQSSLKLFENFEAPAHGKPEGTIVRIACYFADYTGKLEASSEIDEIAWLSFAEKERTSLVDHKIFDALKKQELIY